LLKPPKKEQFKQFIAHQSFLGNQLAYLIILKIVKEV